MTTAQAMECAVGYLHRASGAGGPVDDYALDEELEHGLEAAFARLEAAFGEVTRKDVALAVEAWLVARPDGGIARAIFPLWHRARA